VQVSGNSDTHNIKHVLINTEQSTSILFLKFICHTFFVFGGIQIIGKFLKISATWKECQTLKFIITPATAKRAMSYSLFLFVIYFVEVSGHNLESSQT